MHFRGTSSPKKASLASFCANGPVFPPVLSFVYHCRTPTHDNLSFCIADEDRFFLAINPTGTIVFLSKCWGGRVSEKHLTTECGFLRKLLPGDMVLADRGFDIAEELALCGSSLSIPSFTKGKDELSQAEVETSRQLSRIRIHVERVIGRLKHYSILSSTLPVSFLKTSSDVDYATIDKILITCAALSNLHPCLL